MVLSKTTAKPRRITKMALRATTNNNNNTTTNTATSTATSIATVPVGDAALPQASFSFGPTTAIGQSVETPDETMGDDSADELAATRATELEPETDRTAKKRTLEKAILKKAT